MKNLKNDYEDMKLQIQIILSEKQMDKQKFDDEMNTIKHFAAQMQRKVQNIEQNMKNEKKEKDKAVKQYNNLRERHNKEKNEWA